MLDDHIGIEGIHTREQLAQVKSMVARKARRIAVFNADDPLVLPMREVTLAREVCLVSRRPASPADIASGRVLLFSTVAEIAGHIRETAIRGEAILLKGSFPADHLDRVALDFTLPVRCWLDRCGRGIDCIRCDRLTQESSHRRSIRGCAA